MNELKTFWNEEDGMGTVELVIIIAVLVAIALIFGNTIKTFVTDNLDKIFGEDNQNNLNELMDTEH